MPEPADRQAAERACLVMLAILRPRCGSLIIDAYSDYRDALSPQAADAQRLLRERGAGRSRRPVDPGMGIRIDPSDDGDWALLCDYASWSIHVELYGSSPRETLATLHDCGESVTGRLTEDEAARFTAESGFPIAPLPSRRGGRN